MTRIVRSLHSWRMDVERKAERFSSSHPCLSYLAVFMGIPIFILGGVLLSATAVMLPLSLIFGWF